MSRRKMGRLFWRRSQPSSSHYLNQSGLLPPELILTRQRLSNAPGQYSFRRGIFTVPLQWVQIPFFYHDERCDSPYQCGFASNPNNEWGLRVMGDGAHRSAPTLADLAMLLERTWRGRLDAGNPRPHAGCDEGWAGVDRGGPPSISACDKAMKRHFSAWCSPPQADQRESSAPALWVHRNRASTG